MPERITGTLNGTMHIETYPDHLSLVFVAGEDSTISIRFEEKQQIIEFCNELYKGAHKVWTFEGNLKSETIGAFLFSLFRSKKIDKREWNNARRKISDEDESLEDYIKEIHTYYSNSAFGKKVIIYYDEKYPNK